MNSRALPGATPDDPTMRLVFTTKTDATYHLDQECQRRLASNESVGQTEAILAYHYGRGGCPTCAADFDAELLRQVEHLPRQFAAHPARLPMEWLEPADDLWASTDDPPPYGPAQDPDDLRFDVHSSAGWGTYTYGQNPDEYLGEPTEDDHDWGRGAARFLD